MKQFVETWIAPIVLTILVPWCVWVSYQLIAVSTKVDILVNNQQQIDDDHDAVVTMKSEVNSLTWRVLRLEKK